VRAFSRYLAPADSHGLAGGKARAAAPSRWSRVHCARVCFSDPGLPRRQQTVIVPGRVLGSPCRWRRRVAVGAERDEDRNFFDRAKTNAFPIGKAFEG
jgi:hypothetical protein